VVKQAKVVIDATNDILKAAEKEKQARAKGTVPNTPEQDKIFEEQQKAATDLVRSQLAGALRNADVAHHMSPSTVRFRCWFIVIDSCGVSASAVCSSQRCLHTW